MNTHLDLGNAPDAANMGDKAMTLVHSALAGRRTRSLTRSGGCRRSAPSCPCWEFGPGPQCPLEITGPLGGLDKQRAWIAEDGSTRSTVEVVAEELGLSLRWATATTTRATRSASQPLATPSHWSPFGVALERGGQSGAG